MTAVGPCDGGRGPVAAVGALLRGDAHRDQQRAAKGAARHGAARPPAAAPSPSVPCPSANPSRALVQPSPAPTLALTPTPYPNSVQIFAEKQLKELKNGRLAMIAVLGELMAQQVSGYGTYEQLGLIVKSLPLPL